MSQKEKIISITINTNEIKNPIDMFAYDFVDLVQLNNFKSIFKSPEVFFVPIEGFCFCTPHFKLVETFQEFIKVINTLKGNGFKIPIEYEEAMRIGIASKVEFTEFKESSFYEGNFHLHNSNLNQHTINDGINRNKSNYNDFVDAREMGFESRRDYNNAKQLNCKNAKDYYEFIESDFYQKSNQNREKNNYSDFLNAKEGGFTDYHSYNQARRLGFKDAKVYGQYLESGCENREEFEKIIEFQKSLPELIPSEIEKIEEIKRDIKRAFDSDFREEYLRLSYLLLEKLSELTYIQLYKVPLDKSNEFKIEDIFHKIENKVEKKIIDFDALHKWRILRNNIVHEHVKIDENTLNEAKGFFKSTLSYLEGLNF